MIFRQAPSYMEALARLTEVERGRPTGAPLQAPIYEGLMLSYLEAVMEEKEYPQRLRKRLIGRAGRPTGSPLLLPTPYSLPPIFADAEFDPLGLPFKEAINWFEKRQVVTADRFKLLDVRAQRKAFTVGKLQDEYVLGGIKEELTRAMTEGMGFPDFRESIDDLFDSMGLKPLNPWHLETVYKTNLQTAYEAGRLEQMNEQRDTRPFWQYITMDDGNVRVSHFQWHLAIRTADDPFWLVWYPPNGFNCRCTVVSLSDEEMGTEKLKISREDWRRREFPMPDKGFERMPSLN